MCLVGWIQAITDAGQVIDLLGPYPAEEMAARPGIQGGEQSGQRGPELIAEDSAAPELWG
jgi:hypothetical protein